MQRMLGLTVIAVAAVVLGLLTPVAGAAEERNGSLEFSYDGTDPVGLVLLNHVSEAKPSVSYQVPSAPGGSFMTPWAIVISAGAVTADTLIVLVNPNPELSLVVHITLRDAAGAVNGTRCERNVTIGPKATARKSSRSLFSGCATVTP